MGVILLLLPSSCGLLYQEEIVSIPVNEPYTSEATFFVPGLNRIYSLKADSNTCTAQLRGSIPGSVQMRREIDASLGNGATLRVYAGWPRNDLGEITGITNRSNDAPRNCIYENKLGPTVAWFVWGCKQMCVHSAILHYIVTIQNGSNISYLARIEEPFLDELPAGDHCLRPNFQCTFRNTAASCMGVIDQPGSTLSATGDAYTLLTGAKSLVSESDLIFIDFEHRAFIECDHEIVALTEWGYRLDAQLGLPAYLITPHIAEDINFDLILRDDPDPLMRLAFFTAFVELEALHHRNNCK